MSDSWRSIAPPYHTLDPNQEVQGGIKTLELPKINRVGRCLDRLLGLQEQSSQMTPGSCHPPCPSLQIHATLVALNTKDL